MKTSVLLDHEPVADGGFLVRALLRMEGQAPLDDERVPLNLSLVLDRSGSMQGEPLRAAGEAAAALVRRLRMEDTVSVVAYDNRVSVVAPPATGEEQESLPGQITSIRSGGSTNLSGGWLRGAELVAENRREGGANRVILLTDGLANEGITDPRELVGLTAKGRKQGITTTTIGFGPHFNEDLLRAMAEAGGGGAYYIEKPDQATGIFEEELEGLLSLAAQNVRVAVRPGGDADHVKVLHEYPSHAQGDELTVEVGDLYAREPRLLLLEILLGPDAGATRDADVVTLEVTAQVLTAEGGVELETTSLPITLSPEAGGKVEPEVRREALLLEAAKAREEALEDSHRGDYEAGRRKLRDVVERLEAHDMDDPTLREEIEDLKMTEGLFRAREVHSDDVKYMKQRSYLSTVSRPSMKERLRRTKDMRRTKE